jgi:hypothetical protein
MRFRKRRLRHDASCRNHVSWMVALGDALLRAPAAIWSAYASPDTRTNSCFQPSFVRTAMRILYAGGRQTSIVLKPMPAYIDALTGAMMVDVSRPRPSGARLTLPIRILFASSSSSQRVLTTCQVMASTPVSKWLVLSCKTQCLVDSCRHPVISAHLFYLYSSTFLQYGTSSPFSYYPRLKPCAMAALKQAHMG